MTLDLCRSATEGGSRSTFETLRELALSDAVPIRIRNVVGTLPSDDELLQLTPNEALRRWPEVESHLLGCRAFGAGSSSKLRDALEREVAARGPTPANINSTITKPRIMPGQETLLALASSELAPVRLRNTARSFEPENEIMQLTLCEALSRWPDVETFLANCDGLGLGTIEQFQRTLQRRIEATVPFGQRPLLPHLLYADLKVTESVKRALAGLITNRALKSITVAQGISHWPVLRFHLREQPFVGGQRLAILAEHLRYLVAIVEAPPNDDVQTPEILNLIRFVRSQSISGRVRNVFRDPPKTSPTSQMTSRQALENWDVVEEFLLTKPNFGKRSAHELRKALELRHPYESLTSRDLVGSTELSAQSLIADVAQNPVAEFSGRWLVSLLACPGSDNWQELSRLLETATLIDIVRDPESFEPDNKPWLPDMVAAFLFETKRWFEVSADDQLALSQEGYTHLRLWSRAANSELCTEWIVVQMLLNTLGVHRTTSLLDLTDAKSSDRRLLLRLASGTALHGRDDRARLAGSSIMTRLLDRLGTGPLKADTSAPSPDEMFELLLAGLSIRHRDIVITLFCPTSASHKTLDETGQAFNVTRERIRQITQKWLKLVTDDGRGALAASVVANQEHSWLEHLADQTRPSMHDTSKSTIAAALPQSARLILRASGDTAEKWVARHTVVVDGCLQFIHANDERIAEAEAFLQSVLLRKYELPRLATRIPGAPEHLSISAHSTESVKAGHIAAIATPAGLVLSEDRSARNRRLAFVISVFEEHPDWILSDQQLWNAILQLSGSGLARGKWRVFSDTIRSVACRYRRIPRVGWLDLVDCELSRESTLARRPLLTPRVSMGSRDEAMGDENQRGKLYGLISERGGVYAKECIELWAQHDGLGTGSSAGFLLDDPFFVTSHPGMTSCLDDDGALVNAHAIRDCLLNRKALETYLRLRRGGFVPKDFPAWDVPMLEAWYEWVGRHVEEDVADMLRLQIAGDVKLCDRDGLTEAGAFQFVPDFGLEDSPRRPVDNTIPSMESVFLVIAAAVRFGFLNWYLVNCCTGRHWYSHRSIAWLAFLVAGGFIEARRHWQDPHAITPAGRQLFYLLLTLARNCEPLRWSCSKEGEEVIGRVADCWRENTDGTWINSAEFSRLIAAMMDPVRRQGASSLNSEVFKLSSSRRTLPIKSLGNDTEYVDPFLTILLK